MSEKEVKVETTPVQEEPVKWYSYVVLLFAIVFFAGFFATSKEWYSVFDFTVLNGGFGNIIGEGGKKFMFRGAGGSGAKDGFVFALTLLPSVLFALGVVNVVEGLGGLRAAEKLMTPLLKPLLGIPGACGLGMIAGLQSTDAGAGMIKSLYNNDLINEDEKTILAMFNFSSDGMITNFFSSGAALFGILVTPIIVPLALMFIMKIFGANLMRFYLKYEHSKEAKKGAA